MKLSFLSFYRTIFLKKQHPPFEWVLLNTLYSPFAFEDGFYHKADQKPHKGKDAVEQNARVPRGRLCGVLLGMRVKIPNNVRAVPQKSANKGNHKRIQKTLHFVCHNYFSLTFKSVLLPAEDLLLSFFAKAFEDKVVGFVRHLLEQFVGNFSVGFDRIPMNFVHIKPGDDVLVCFS